MSREDDEEAGESSDEDEAEPLGRRQSAVLFLRDVVVAVVVVVVIIAAVVVYTQVWPPMVVVESESMQHSNTQSYIGVIDTGDLVLVQATPSRNDVVTWVEGKASGHRTYGDFGDVIIFRPTTHSLTSTPIIHRPIFYALWNFSSGQGYDVPSLRLLDPTLWSTTTENGSPWNHWYDIRGDLTLRQFGFDGVLTRSVSFPLLMNSERNKVDGYITKGDYNSGFDTDYGVTPHSRVQGKARGELPWFGLLKLILSPGTCCKKGWGDDRAPKSSWDSLLLSLVLVPIGLYLADSLYVFGEDSWKWWRGSKKRGKRAKGGRRSSDPEEPPDSDAVR